MTFTVVETAHQTFLLHIERTSIDSDCCRLPTASVLSNKAESRALRSVLTNKSKFLKVTHHTDIRKESFNDWRGRGCHKFVSVLGGDDTQIAPLGDLFDQPSTETG